MTVSVIVPIYNAEKWFPQCLASIKAQSYKDVELIVIDDAQASGAAAARNRGLDKATGEFVAFVDADDYLEPNAIEYLVDAIEGVDMVCGSFRKFGDFDAIVNHETETLGIDHVAKYVMHNLLNPRRNQMLSGCWAKLYRRTHVGRFPPLATAEDMAFNFNYLKHCYVVRFIEEIVYNNRKHTGSLTTTFDPRNKASLFGFLKGLRYVETFLRHHSNYDDDALTLAIDNSKVYHSMLYFMRICEHSQMPMNDVFKRLYP